MRKINHIRWILTVKRPMCVLSFIFMIMVWAVTGFAGGVDESAYINDGKSVYVLGCVTDIVNKNGVLSLHVSGCSTGTDINNMIKSPMGRNRMILYMSDVKSCDVRLGQVITAKGAYNNFSLPENDGQFNMRRYYRIRGYEASLKNTRIIKAACGYSRYRQLLYSAKEKTKNFYTLYMDDEEAGTLSAMVLGDKSVLDEDIKDIYQAAGISHILSLSGLHIATVGMFIFSVLTATGLNICIASLFSIVIIISYGVLTGLSISTIRALVMFLLAVLAKNIGRTYDILSALSLASVLILFENPLYVYDSGFLLSFLSVIGIAVIYPVLDDITTFNDSSGKHSGLHKIVNSTLVLRIRQSICISLSATMATLPVTMNSFYRISRYSVFVNIVVVPLMSGVLFLGIISAITGNLFTKMVMFRSAAAGCLMIAEKILRFYKYLSIKVSEIPGNLWITGDTTSIRIIFYISLIFSVCIIYGFISKDKNCKKKRHVYKLPAVLAIIASVFILTGSRKPEYSINVLSVGQGACNVIFGEKTPTIVIDGGSTDIKKVGKYRISPFIYSKGINKIDYLFITHNDADHINGIRELISDKYSAIKIRHIFMSEPDEEITEYARDNDIPVYYFKSGDKMQAGEMIIQCFNPLCDENSSVSGITSSERPNASDNNNSESSNDKSLVIKVSYKDFDALFTGDIGSEEEKRILDAKEDIKSDFMTIAHHGSRNSNSMGFLSEVNARICTISSGAGNSYGHPHKETLNRLVGLTGGPKVFRTDECGQISVICENDKTYVRKFKK